MLKKIRKIATSCIVLTFLFSTTVFAQNNYSGVVYPAPYADGIDLGYIPADVLNSIPPEELPRTRSTTIPFNATGFTTGVYIAGGTIYTLGSGKVEFQVFSQGAVNNPVFALTVSYQVLDANSNSVRGGQSLTRTGSSQGVSWLNTCGDRGQRVKLYLANVSGVTGYSTGNAIIA